MIDYKKPATTIDDVKNINNKTIFQIKQLDNAQYISGLIDPRILGLAGLLNPFINSNSSQRNMMFFSHLFQFVIPNKPEVPNIFTGYELLLNDYAFNTQPEKEIIIDTVIPKYEDPNNPLYVVIYQDPETKVYDSFNVYSYYRFGNEYGFTAKIKKELLTKNTLSPNEKVMQAVNQTDDGMFCYGINANVCFIMHPGTWEDAVVISRSLAKKLAPKKIKREVINVTFNYYPINTYGDEYEYKIIPDLGSTIRDDGIICAFRRDDIYPLLYLNKHEINKINYFTDKIVYGSPGAKIIDITVYFNKTKLLKIAYDQLLHYHSKLVNFFKKIIDWYLDHEDANIGPHLQNLIIKAAKFLMLARINIPKLYSTKNEKLAMFYKRKADESKLIIEITYMEEMDFVYEGYKLTGRDGCKGIICKVVDDEQMPVDEHGIRADILVNPLATIKRTILSQFKEQFITRGIELLIRTTKNYDPNYRFNLIIDYIKHINPVYAEQLIEEYKNNPSVFLNKIEKEGLPIWIPPTAKIDSEVIFNLAKAFGIDKSKITFKTVDETGKLKEITIDGVMIGSKYLLLLYKYPVANCVNIAKVNKYFIPIKPTNKRVETIFNMKEKPTRFGEDEHRMLMLTVDPDVINRIRLFNYSKEGIQTVIRELINTEHPTRIRRMPITTKELIDDNRLIKVGRLNFKILGINIKKL